MTLRVSLVGVILMIASQAMTQQASIPLELLPAGHSATVQDLGDGAYEVRTVGADPYVLCKEIKGGYDADELAVFAFDYICADGLDYFQVLMIAPESGWVDGTVPDIAATADWTECAVDVSAIRPDEWKGAVTQFRIDFGPGEGKTVRVRNIRLRPMTPAEAAAKAEAEAAERQRLADLTARIEESLIAPERIADTSTMVAATHRFGRTQVAVLGRELDLATQLADHADVDTPVSLPPSLVVGEGPSPENHTVVRILNRHHICEVQFLAFPPDVTGGVQVCTGTIDGQPTIVAAPLAGRRTREIRLFDANGNPLSSINPSASLRPPYRIAVGDFTDANPGDEIAVAPAVARGGEVPVAVYSGAGEEIARADVPMPDAGGAALSLSETDSGLLVYAAGQPDAQLLARGTLAPSNLDLDLSDDCTGVYQAADGLAASVDEPEFSSLVRLGGDRSRRINVGERENLFYVTVAGAFSDVPETRYVRHSQLAHIRTDFASPNARTPDFGRADAEFWAGDGFQDFVNARLANYDTDPPVCWEPCFTHRWFAGSAEKWTAAVDPETGLPAYVLVSRDNEIGHYGEFGATDAFVTGSYAPFLQPTESFYTYPQRAFLRGLIERFRANPEHFVGVEPNHEMEINADSEATHGDYNPNMLRAFYRYLASLYGGLDGINEVFGTDFTPQRFDAPRGLDRGDWDAYSTSNPYYVVWMRFLNYVIYRVVSGTYREALLAGFPPEAIKCHQIPDNYAISSLTAFSKPARRITPIDWNLNAGVGYGFTRYGVWFNREHNCVQGPHSSGFDSMVIGEYQSLHPDADLAYQQLEYMRTHGVQFIHDMNWPPGHDKGFNAALDEALKRLAGEDRPRPGFTGGTGQVRAAGDSDIVEIGVGEGHTGLLKSVTAEGDWEGSVYVVPFHAHVAIEPLVAETSLALDGDPLVLGPFEGITSGNQIEVSFAARADRDTDATLRVYHHGIEVRELALTVPVTGEWTPRRCIVRVQIDTDDVGVELSGEGIELRDLLAVRHAEQTTKLKQGIFEGQRHQGGVTFDVLDR